MRTPWAQSARGASLVAAICAIALSCTDESSNAVEGTGGTGAASGAGAGGGIGGAGDTCEQGSSTTNSAGPIGKVERLFAGTRNVCALLEGGSIRCWGDNINGQIGSGDLVGGIYPTAPVGLPPVQQVAIGVDHMCALSLDGCVWCWGANGWGQLGRTDVGGSWKPLLVDPLMGITHISGYARTEAALTREGTVLSWGEDSHPLDNLPSFWVAGPAYQSIDIGYELGCGLREDGLVECWGSNQYGQLGTGDYVDHDTPVVVEGLSSVEQIAVGGGAVCAIRSDKSLWCWGHNEWGELGDGTTTNRPEPQQVALANVEGISMESVHACAYTASGQVFCWGYNSSRQVGNGATDDIVTEPWEIMDMQGARGVVAANSSSCALQNDHDVYCWGYNKAGALGDGTFQNSSTPVAVVWDPPQ